MTTFSFVEAADLDEMWQRFEQLLPPQPRPKALVRKEGVLVSYPAGLASGSLKARRMLAAMDATARP